MIPEDFPQTGLAFWRRGAAPIRRFQVIGERSSGTNLLKRTLGRNTPLKPTEHLGWKHGPPCPIAIPADFAVLLIVRRADSWARSMHAKPWHTRPHMQHLGFSQFIQAPWDTCLDHPRYFGDLMVDGAKGQPLQPDRDPLTGQVFDNLFALRQSKLVSMLSYIERDCTFGLVRLETLNAEPERVLAGCREAFDLPASHGAFKPVHKRLGSRFAPAVPDRPETPETLSGSDMAFLKSQIDAPLERALGYRYG